MPCGGTWGGWEAGWRHAGWRHASWEAGWEGCWHAWHGIGGGTRLRSGTRRRCGPAGGAASQGKAPSGAGNPPPPPPPHRQAATEHAQLAALTRARGLPRGVPARLTLPSPSTPPRSPSSAIVSTPGTLLEVRRGEAPCGWPGPSPSCREAASASGDVASDSSISLLTDWESKVCSRMGSSAEGLRRRLGRR